jgi:hypothetical protein
LSEFARTLKRVSRGPDAGHGERTSPVRFPFSKTRPMGRSKIRRSEFHFVASTFRGKLLIVDNFSASISKILNFDELGVVEIHDFCEI